MTSVVKRLIFAATIALASLGTFVSARLASADDRPAASTAASDKPDGGSPPAMAQTEPSSPPPETEPKADATPPPSLGPLERLPPSAYPAPRVRGIKGGSLWLTFHGLQWPYYPKTGIGISGSIWVDTAFQRLTPGESLKGIAGQSPASEDYGVSSAGPARSPGDAHVERWKVLRARASGIRSQSDRFDRWDHSVRG